MEFTRATIRMNGDGQAQLVGLTGPGPEVGESLILKEGMDSLAEKCHATSKEKGFWDHATLLISSEPGPADPTTPNPSIVPEKLALIHSEVSEALEAHRDDDKGLVEEELADIIIRVLDLAAASGYSMDTAVRAKMEKNTTRPHLHGRKM